MAGHTRRQSTMHLTITRPLVGCVDGVRLKYLVPGRTYAVWPALGHYLFAVGGGARCPRRVQPLPIPAHARVGGPGIVRSAALRPMSTSGPEDVAEAAEEPRGIGSV